MGFMNLPTYLTTEFIYYLVIGMVKIDVQYKNDCGLNFTPKILQLREAS